MSWAGSAGAHGSDVAATRGARNVAPLIADATDIFTALNI